MPATKSRRKKNPAHTAYERALVLLYKGHYAKAQAALETLAQKYPDEKQLMAQVRMFLRLCEQNNQPPKKVAQDGVALYDAGVFEHNRGRFEKALELFKRPAMNFLSSRFSVPRPTNSAERSAPSARPARRAR